jgi:hypothetical protein
MPNTNTKFSTPGRKRSTITPHATEVLDIDPSQPLPQRSEELFVQAYLANGLNATRAYRSVHPRAKASTADVESRRTLGKPRIAARIAHLANAQATKFEIKGEELLRHAKAVALADARELVQYVYRCCPYCHGKGHKFQRTSGEMEQDRSEHAKAERKREATALLANKPYTPAEFDEMGGPGFNEWMDPHPDCPNCHGHGIGRIEIADTRNLSPEAAVLFAGVEMTKDGLRVLMHDKMKALDMLLRHKGLYEADNAQQIGVVSPEMLAALDAAMERAMTTARAQHATILADRKARGFLGN